ncbi:hypothetical protein V5O48_016219 [Marasmius crinis-equi]|uniref:Sensor domain-containing protein n=1 Tax=Marasmius crinis-equi TaxID=585013 RepID=A0ABR3ESC3_9AGAR
MVSTTTAAAAVAATNNASTTPSPSPPPMEPPSPTTLTTPTSVIIPEPPQQSIQALINDPPPPYPAPSRPRRARRANNLSSNSTNANANETPAPVQSDSEETTPLLRPVPGRRGPGRPRSASHGSVFSSASAAPSLAQTVVSLFQTEYDSDYDAEEDECEGDQGNEGGDGRAQRTRRRTQNLTDASFSSEDEQGLQHSRQATRTHGGHQYTQLPHFTVQDSENNEERHAKSRLRTRLFSLAFWRRYYHPFTRRPYWAAFFHLLVVNFPVALTAWVYLFVFTLTGTALLITLPIGAILCFLNAIGARTFARVELYLQTKFHKPSLSLYSHHHQQTQDPNGHPYPLFTRVRPPSAAEIESGVAVAGEMVREESFYRNSYAMFADSTTYQSLFYFLVIKPPITLGLFLLTICVFGPMLILGPITGPMALRATRRLGRWQAGVAVDGLVGRRG